MQSEQLSRKRSAKKRPQGVTLTRAERKALLAAASMVLAGEWPFHDIRPETLERAKEKL
jgi:hypothetical protein